MTTPPSRASLFLLLLASLHHSWITPVDAEGNARRQRRRRLAPNESIHRYLKQENDAGNMRPRFTLAAMKVKVDDDEHDESSDSSTENFYDIDVVQANQAITERTTYFTDEGGPYPIGNLGVKFLVQDRMHFGAEEDSTAHDTATTFALISVDEDSGEVNGIVKKLGDKAMNVQQFIGASAMATPADDFVPPKDFSCQVTGDEIDDYPRHIEHHQADHQTERFRIRNKRKGVFDRELEDLHHEHHHEHNHHDHTHDHNHNHIFSENDMDNLMDDISRTATHQHNHKNNNQQWHPHRRTATKGFPATPSHQVDLFIEIDQHFINTNGKNLTTAFRYVYTLVTAASTIYEAEVNTRLTVASIKVTDNYENYTNSRDALFHMKDTYGNSSGEWHYNEGHGIDLHHAILGKKMNGGVAFVGRVCSPEYGFGISPGMRGSFLSLDFATVWDVSVLSHEIGHSFGVLHTYDRRVEQGGFKPPVDRCYIRSGDSSSCPSDAKLEGSATIMSYCDSCPEAGASTLAYTFGGDFVGSNASNIDEWRNNPSLVGSFNYEPKRVPKQMYDHISSRTCTQPNFSCTEDSDCYDWLRCTADTCNKVTGQCERTVREDCCGNGVCEQNELPCGLEFCKETDQTCSEDCGPFNLETSECEKCNAKRGRGNGIMFDIENKLTSDIVVINSIDFRHTQTQSSEVIIYTTHDGYIHKATTPEDWVAANMSTIEIGGKKGGYATIVFKVPVAISARSIRSFYIASTGKLISGLHEDGQDYLAMDESVRIKYPARIVGHPFGGGSKGSWDGKINYSIYPSR
eukprot:CAMPEP_0183715640 /NCGR_PEP_ID=MMETSP0737-20130205/9783_1 /TAXON_ID=385413 /ORGANISM="Thalassiosira miniscula, Strain CCMP1093" /LENGTH=800 /DNA_ID=CAMNT_0025944757 /DNA_START=137 /DNA_END=2539 /DNA_ORIENTATION=+